MICAMDVIKKKLLVKVGIAVFIPMNTQLFLNFSVCDFEEMKYDYIQMIAKSIINAFLKYQSLTFNFTT